MSREKLQQLDAGILTVVLDNKGQIISLKNKNNKKEYGVDEKKVSFIKLIVNGNQQLPSLMYFDEKRNIYNFQFNNINVQVQIAVKVNDCYTTFEVAKMKNPENHDLEVFLWGSIPTNIKYSIGETVGVVHDGEFAIGIQTLNIKTLGGWPKEYIDYGYPDGPGSNKDSYELCTAWPTDWGSVLQAYTRDFTRTRTRNVGVIKNQKMLPLNNDDGKIIGSKIALFGCDLNKVLDTISNIELTENLPHPMINDEWVKTSKYATQAYLITDFNKNTVLEAVEYAKKAGFKYIYTDGAWKSWGHFEFDNNFSGTDKGMKEVVDKAKENGVNIGIHTLSNFIHTYDSYVTPVPDIRLQKAGSAKLTRDLDENAVEIFIDNPEFFKGDTSGKGIKNIVIDSEIIRYVDVQRISDYEWTLVGCHRGDRGTKAVHHKKGTDVFRFWVHYYDTFFPNIEMQKELSSRIANVFNSTGMKQISFDGLEGCLSTGYDTYAMNKFVMDFYNNLNNTDNLINDASRLTHFLWHFHTRMNWGEPWGAAMREGMIDYRVDNQAYFERNFFPKMFGWFKFDSANESMEATSLIDIEWMLSKAVAFDTGFALYSEMNALKNNGNTDEVLETIRQWETARRQGAFNESQKKRMKEQDKDWHLEVVEEGSKWRLYSVQFPVKPLVKLFNEFQPGSNGVDWMFKNINNTQPLRFRLRVLEGSLENPSFMVDGHSMVFNIKVDHEQYLVCEGDMIGKLYDKNWNLIQTVNSVGDVLYIKKGMAGFSFAGNYNSYSPKAKAEVYIITKSKSEQVFVGNTETGFLKPIVSIKGKQKVLSNNQFDLNLKLENVSKNILAEDIIIKYDKDRFKLIGAEAMKELYFDNQKSVLQKDGEVRLILASKGLKNAISKDSEFITIKFEVSDILGDTTIYIEKALLSDELGNEISAEVESFDISVQKPSIGDLALIAVCYGANQNDEIWDKIKELDLNDDGQIDCNDLILKIKQIIS